MNDRIRRTFKTIKKSVTLAVRHEHEGSFNEQLTQHLLDHQNRNLLDQSRSEETSLSH